MELVVTASARARATDERVPVTPRRSECMARGRRATRAAWKAVLESKQAGRGAHHAASVHVRRAGVLLDDRRDAQVWTIVLLKTFYSCSFLDWGYSPK